MRAPSDVLCLKRATEASPVLAQRSTQGKPVTWREGREGRTDAVSSSNAPGPEVARLRPCGEAGPWLGGRAGDDEAGMSRGRRHWPGLRKER